jgi:hypothetical protein
MGYFSQYFKAADFTGFFAGDSRVSADMLLLH